MAWVFSVYLLPNFLAAGLALLIAGVAWRHREERTARPFIVLMVSIAVWTMAYGIELGQTTVSGVILWDKIAFIPSVIVPPVIFLLGLEYAGLEERVPRWTPAVLLIIPVITLFFVWRYPSSQLVWESVGHRRAGELTIPMFDFGPWYLVNLAYSYLLVAGALSLFGYVFIQGSRIYRRQSALLIAGAAVPLGANLLYNLFTPVGPLGDLDLTTYAMAATGVLYGIALYRFRMLDFAPKSRGILLRRVGDGFLLYDTDGEIIESNEIGEAARSQDIVPMEEPFTADHNQPDLEGEVVTISIDGKERTYELLTERVIDFRDEHIGSLLVFRDITELRVIQQQEQRLSVLNRILRHNIRNEMNLVGGLSRGLADSLEGQKRDEAMTIAESAERMVSIGEKTRRISTDLDLYQRRQSVDIVPVITGVCRWARSEFPEANVRVTVPETAIARVTATDDLETALRYLVENAVQHSDVPHPTVEITIETTDEEAMVIVSDNGPGLPKQEYAVLDSDREIPLEHGSGLGLWVANWLIQQSNGSLTFHENDPRGTEVRIHLGTPPGGEPTG